MASSAKFDRPYLPLFLWRSALTFDTTMRGKQPVLETIPEDILILIWMQGVEPTVEDVAEAVNSPVIFENYLQSVAKRAVKSR